jgi:hypothetical protein
LSVKAIRELIAPGSEEEAVAQETALSVELIDIFGNNEGTAARIKTLCQGLRHVVKTDRGILYPSQLAELQVTQSELAAQMYFWLDMDGLNVEMIPKEK